tara:strand:+ start:47 stop:421 length:375 start_codon:yes stop_codon:yes gene_type:complete
MSVYGHKNNLIEEITVRDKTDYDGTVGMVWQPKADEKILNSVDHEIVSNEEVEVAYNLLLENTDYSEKRVDNHYLYNITKNDEGEVIGYHFNRMSDRQTLGHKKDRVYLIKNKDDKWKFDELLA